MKRALFLGRFQPFHNGHLKDLIEFSEKYDEVILAIGSKQKSKTKDNPYTYEERKEMITNVLKDHKLENVNIVGIEDIHNNDKYVTHVEKHIPPCDIFYSGNDLTIRLFKKAGYNVKKLPRYWELSASKIRELMDQKKEWGELVPNKVYEYINAK